MERCSEHPVNQRGSLAILRCYMTRVQLDLSDREMQRLEYIMEVCDLKSRKDLFGNAFTALEWMVGETRAGRRIMSIQEDGGDKHVLNLPALQNVQVTTNQPRHFAEPQGSDTSASAQNAVRRNDTPRPGQVKILGAPG